MDVARKIQSLKLPRPETKLLEKSSTCLPSASGMELHLGAPWSRHQGHFRNRWRQCCRPASGWATSVKYYSPVATHSALVLRAQWEHSTICPFFLRCYHCWRSRCSSASSSYPNSRKSFMTYWETALFPSQPSWSSFIPNHFWNSVCLPYYWASCCYFWAGRAADGHPPIRGQSKFSAINGSSVCLGATS